MRSSEEVKIGDSPEYSEPTNQSFDGQNFDYLNQAFSEGTVDEKIIALKSLICDRLRESQFNFNRGQFDEDVSKNLINPERFDIKYSETHDDGFPVGISIEIILKERGSSALLGYFGGKDRFRGIVRSLLTDHFPHDQTNIYVVSSLRVV